MQAEGKHNFQNHISSSCPSAPTCSYEKGLGFKGQGPYLALDCLALSSFLLLLVRHLLLEAMHLFLVISFLFSFYILNILIYFFDFFARFALKPPDLLVRWFSPRSPNMILGISIFPHGQPLQLYSMVCPAIGAGLHAGG